MLMNRDIEALTIYHARLPPRKKLHLLEELALDLRNELEAEDQNMHPDVYDELSEGLRLTTNFIRELHQRYPRYH